MATTIKEINKKVRRFIVDWNTNHLDNPAIMSRYNILTEQGLDAIGKFLCADDVNVIKIKTARGAK